jgi:hypothetical protein
MGSGWKFISRCVSAVVLVALPWVGGLSPATASQHAGTVYALTDDDRLIRFNRATPGYMEDQTFIVGLRPGERIVGIDVRPSNGRLYAIGSTSRVYTIDPSSGLASQVGTNAFTPALSGSEFGVDFNPVVDRIRVVSNTGQNLRLHPDTGAIAGVDTALSFAAGDANQGRTPFVTGAAYANNVAGATATTLYDIDAARDILVTQSPPNNGTLNTVGALGVDTSALVGFDIVTAGAVNTALASLTRQEGNGAAIAVLYQVDLVTGAASVIGKIAGPKSVRDIAAAL